LRLAIALLTAVIASAAAEAPTGRWSPGLHIRAGIARSSSCHPAAAVALPFQNDDFNMGIAGLFPGLTVYEAPAILYAPDFADVPYIGPCRPIADPPFPIGIACPTPASPTATASVPISRFV